MSMHNDTIALDPAHSLMLNIPATPADILAGPFVVAHERGDSGAAEHLQLLLSFCHAKEHASQAADLLLSLMAHLYTSQSPPAACVSIVAQLALRAGTHCRHDSQCVFLDLYASLPCVSKSPSCWLWGVHGTHWKM